MLACWIGRDYRLAATLGEPSAKLAGIVGTVGNQLVGYGDATQESSGANEVVGIAGRDREGERTPILIGQRVNLGRPSAARSPDRVDEVPPFAPAAERCALTWVESIAADEMTPLEPVRA